MEEQQKSKFNLRNTMTKLSIDYVKLDTVFHTVKFLIIMRSLK